MKKIIYLVIIIAFASCKHSNSNLNKMPSEIFVKYISKNSNSKKGIKKIDSILKFEKKLNTNKKGLLYYFKGEYLFEINKFEHSIINFKKSLVFFEEDKNEKYTAIVHNGLGRANTKIKKFDIALNELNLALQMFKKIDDNKNVLVALDGLAFLQFSQNEYSKAAESIKKLLTINLKLKDSATVAKNYGNLGYISELLMDKKQAENYYLKAVNINRKISSNNTTQLRNLGGFYLAINKKKESEKLLFEALKIETKKENTLALKEIYDLLIDSINNVKIPNFYELVIKKDSINTLINKQESEEKIKLIEGQYTLITKEKELLQKQKDQFNNKISFLIITGLLLMIGMYLHQKNKNSKLQLIQDKLALEQKILRAQMNPHFIFNALTSIQKNLLEKDLLKSSISLSRFAKLIRQNFEFTSKELIGLDEDLDALKNYIETQQMRFENKFNYKINISKDLDLSYIKIPPLLLQPFVENAIEHGLKSKKEKGNLTINISENKDLILFEIIDDGIGYEKPTAKKNDRTHAIDIFFNRLKLRGIGEENSFKIQPSLKNGKGTKIFFALKL